MDENKKLTEFDTQGEIATPSEQSEVVTSPAEAELISIESEAPTGAAIVEAPTEATADVEAVSLEVTESAEEVAEPQPAIPVNTTEPPREVSAGLSVIAAEKAKPRRKRTLVFATLIGVVLVAGGLVTWQLLSRKVQDTQAASPADTKTAVIKLGATTFLIEGKAMHKTATGDWQTLRVSESLSEGDTVRTEESSRAVLAFDDGSVLRLDASSSVRIESLASTDIKIVQLTGAAYSRVVPSAERSYAVVLGDVSYTAGGTAFRTEIGTEEAGVQVYESTVKVEGLADAVAEGKQYYEKNKDTTLAAKITDISLAGLEKDTFIKWNIAQDKLVADFKAKLGVLANVKSEYKAGETQTTSSSAKKEDVTATTTDGALHLDAQAVTGGAKLTWKTTDLKAPNGFKLLRSATSSSPTFGEAEATYVSSPTASSYTWGSTKSGMYWYRVCIYHSDGTCSDYSNTVKLQVTVAEKTAPAPQKVTRGTMKLWFDESGKASWSYTGKAIYGYKLVVSKSRYPTYPDSTSVYFSNGIQSGTVPVGQSGDYYIRICAWTNNTETEPCVDYSNQVKRYLTKS